MRFPDFRWCLAGAGLVVLGLNGVSAEDLGFVSQTDRNPLAYAVGEPMTFTLTLVDRDNGNAPVKGRNLVWTRDGDDGRQENGAATSDAPLVLTTSIDSPGFVRLTVNVLDAAGKVVEGHTHRFDGSAGADIFSMPEWPEPTDFRAFWNTAVEGLYATSYETNVFEACEGDADIEYRVFELSTFPGERPATGIVAWPKGAAPGSLPIVAQAFGYAAPSQTALPNRADVLSGNGVIRVSLCRYGEHPRDPDPSYYTRLWQNELAGYCFRNNDGAVEDTDHYKMLMRDLRALQFVKTFKEWNRTSLTLIGGSMGGYQAIGCTALDKDVTACGAGIPWSADLSGCAKFGRMKGWRPDWTPTLDYVDLKNLAKLVTIPMANLEVGLGDYTCPPSGEVMLYRSLAVCPKRMKFTQNMCHDGVSGVNPPFYYLEQTRPAASGDWFDARIDNYLNWPGGAALAVGGEWTAGAAALTEAAALLQSGALGVSWEKPLTFAADVGKAPGRDSRKVVIRATFDFASFEAESLPAIDPSVKCGVAGGKEDGVPYYYALAKIGAANEWVRMDGPAICADDVAVEVTLTNVKGRTFASYAFNGVTYTFGGQSEIEVVAESPVTAVDLSGPCELRALSAESDPLKGLILIFR